MPSSASAWAASASCSVSSRGDLARRARGSAPWPRRARSAPRARPRGLAQLARLERDEGPLGVALGAHRDVLTGGHRHARRRTAPAMPASTMAACRAVAPATPTTTPAVETMPSLAPSTPARSQLSRGAEALRRAARRGRGPRRCVVGMDGLDVGHGVLRSVGAVGGAAGHGRHRSWHLPPRVSRRGVSPDGTAANAGVATCARGAGMREDLNMSDIRDVSEADEGDLYRWMVGASPDGLWVFDEGGPDRSSRTPGWPRCSVANRRRDGRVLGVRRGRRRRQGASSATHLDELASKGEPGDNLECSLLDARRQPLLGARVAHPARSTTTECAAAGCTASASTAPSASCSTSSPRPSRSPGSAAGSGTSAPTA